MLRRLRTRFVDRSTPPLAVAVGRLLQEGSWIQRRVTTIEIDRVDPDVVLRVKVSLDISGSKVRRVAGSPQAVLPVGLYPKGFFEDFSIRNESGRAVRVSSRLDDSEVAAAILYNLGAGSESPRDADSSELVTQALFDHVFGMASSFSSGDGRPAETFLARLQHEAAFARDGAALAWIESATASPEFARFFALTAEHFLLLVKLPDSSESALLKVSYTIPSPNSLGVLNLGNTIQRFFRPELAEFEFRSPDHGWPLSDHLRLIAPEETFISDTIIFPDERAEVVDFESGGTISRPIFYVHNSASREIVLSGLIAPTKGGYTLPALLISVMVAVTLLGGGIAEFLTQWTQCGSWPQSGLLVGPSPEACERQGFLAGFAGQGGAAISLGFLGPTALLAYALRTDEPSIRRTLLQRWRTISVASLLLSWTGMVALAVNRDLQTPWILWESWMILGTIAFIMAVMTSATYLEIGRSRKVRKPRYVVVTRE